jgi:hypothetical protein
LQEYTATPAAKSLLKTIVVNLKGLKDLDLSRNALSKDTLGSFLQLLAQGSSSGRLGHVQANLAGLQSLNLSYVNMQRDSVQLLVTVIGNLRQLRRLDISGIALQETDAQ